MSGHAELERIVSDYSTEELHAVLSSLMGGGPVDICEVAAVVIVHPPGGGHEIKVIVDGDQDGERVATVLRHAADHAYGGCARCRRANRQRGRRRGG